MMTAIEWEKMSDGNNFGSVGSLRVVLFIACKSYFTLFSGQCCLNSVRM
jgi:hypothetical protein